MSTEMMLLELQTPQEWRTWLAHNHSSSPGVWLVFPKGPDGAKRMPYEATVRAALCFGWIDSLIQYLDADRFARKFTPRKPGSNWSALNRKRWSELKEAGLLTPAGLAAAPTGDAAPRPVIPTDIPDHVVKAFKKNAKAWDFFQTLTPRERCRFAYWIDVARRPETRERRIRESITLLSAGKKLGLK